MRRWPDDPPPVTPEQLHMAIGMAEMNAGNAAEAERQLRESLRAQESTAALVQLGLLLERTGRAREAADIYRRALEVNKTADGDDERERAELLERLGDALRLSGAVGEAQSSYEQGLAIWDQNLARLKGRRVGAAQLRRGVLLGRLSRPEAALGAFELAMENAPGTRETYATILSYLVGAAPDAGFAHRVFRHAQNQVSLEPEWKVYFALWLGAVDAQQGAPGVADEADVREVLDSLAGGESWSGKLAAFGAGRIIYAELLEQASGAGEQTEAHFYEGVRLLRAGDRAGARAKFEQVLGTHMVNFYEYAMAQELVARVGVASAAAPAVSAAPQAAPVSPAPESPRAAPAPAR
jgi:tetratricopeptide (TPR) repeat protein